MAWNKYQQQKKQVSTDGGETWADVIPYEYRAGDLIEANSPDCTPENPDCPIRYKWEYSPNERMCMNGDEYSVERQYYSKDCGVTWLSGGQTRTYQLLVTNSDCCDGNEYICEPPFIPVTPPNVPDITNMTEVIPEVTRSYCGDYGTYNCNDSVNYTYYKSSEDKYGWFNPTTGIWIEDANMVTDTTRQSLPYNSTRLGLYEWYLSYTNENVSGDSLIPNGGYNAFEMLASTSKAFSIYNYTILRKNEINGKYVTNYNIYNLKDLLGDSSTDVSKSFSCFYFPRQKEAYFIYPYNDTIIYLNTETNGIGIYNQNTERTIRTLPCNWTLYTNNTLRPVIKDGVVYIANVTTNKYLNGRSTGWPWEYYFDGRRNTSIFLAN